MPALSKVTASARPARTRISREAANIRRVRVRETSVPANAAADFTRCARADVQAGAQPMTQPGGERPGLAPAASVLVSPLNGYSPRYAAVWELEGTDSPLMGGQETG